jgi:hypothetical protein
MPCVLFQMYYHIEPKQASGSDRGNEHISTSESETLQEVWEFCKRRSKSVEIHYENMNGCKILTRVHFQFDPHVNLILVEISK